MVQSYYQAKIDSELCSACGQCIERCQMAAIKEGEESSEMIEGRCIGCGLCVTTCPSEAIHLGAHPTRRVPPKDTGRLYMQMFRDRFGATGLAATVARRALGMKT